MIHDVDLKILNVNWKIALFIFLLPEKKNQIL